MTECRRCNGSGTVYAYGAEVTCFRCVGSGEEPACPSCVGVGVVPWGATGTKPCPECRGISAKRETSNVETT
jgi:DnaJ-class molecular chaperone